MKFWKLLSFVGTAAVVFAVVPGAAAQCGSLKQPIKPTNWHLQMDGARPSLVRATFEDDDRGPSIVGMWHVKFTASDGSVFDDSVVQWHPDGTEIMNSQRPAQDGNFCMGVWTRTGERRYLLNHIPWKGNDPTGTPQDGAQLIEKVTLSPDGNSYTGTYTFVPYDQNGNAGPVFTGTISAKRITTETPFTDLL
ncbi:MAG: hypothetical protein WBF42_12560 [Terracidiphilus sp.]